MDKGELQSIVRYHEETKHHYHRYARSAGHMDWENQPHPFRVYRETAVVELPLLKQDPPGGHGALYRPDDNRQSREISRDAIAGFLELSLGLSAWKAVGASRWALRINPSSGNLHPTEAHLILPATASIEAGVYHYLPLNHVLEKRAAMSDSLWRDIQAHFKTAGFFIGLTSIFWRESWKYGERAFRYCNLDAGHALAAIRFSANLFGWKATWLNTLSDEAVATLLGMTQTKYPHLDEEHPDLLCFVYPRAVKDVPQGLPDEIQRSFSDLRFSGRPNALSDKHVNWEIIYHAARCCLKPATQDPPGKFGQFPEIQGETSTLRAAEIIRQRRSATSFDPDGEISRRRFLTLLDKTLPRDNRAPFDVEPGPPAIHLLLFVHRVQDLTPGIYFLFRNQDDIQEIQALSRPEFLWQPVDDSLPLFLLQPGNFRQSAMMISCHQEIAGFSCFSLGMIARFRDHLQAGPYRYRHLFWEAGMIGQVLYLEAEAQAVRGTGIGCFFDDAVHELMGFKDSRYQSLYHFTVGRPVEDPRLTTYPPYHHLQDR